MICFLVSNYVIFFFWLGYRDEYFLGIQLVMHSRYKIFANDFTIQNLEIAFS